MWLMDASPASTCWAPSWASSKRSVCRRGRTPATSRTPPCRTRRQESGPARVEHCCKSSILTYLNLEFNQGLFLPGRLAAKFQPFLPISCDITEYDILKTWILVWVPLPTSQMSCGKWDVSIHDPHFPFLTSHFSHEVGKLVHCFKFLGHLKQLYLGCSRNFEQWT